MQETSKSWKRKDFIVAAIGLSAYSVLPKTVTGSSLFYSKEKFTVSQVIDLLLKTIPGAPFKQTVDTIKAGDVNMVVTGIVTTMFPTIEVIEKTAKAGANFIIAHEPTFYNHADETKWLENDEAYQYKITLLKKYNIAVWRCHDYIHAHQPDGVMAGVLAALGWEKYLNPGKPYLLNVPPVSLRDIITLAKDKMKITHVKYVGDLSQSCSRIAFIPGAAGGRTQINAVATEKPDLLIVGEVNEWETSEYIRDLRASGRKISLLLLGHIVSEEPGMAWLANWLQPQVPGIRVSHIPSGDAFSWA